MTELLPGTWGVSHGAGFLGNAVRAAELAMSNGDQEASWAGHAFVYAGHYPLAPGRRAEPVIVEAEWPKVKLSPLGAHSDARWAVHQPLTELQRANGSAAALALLGKRYNWLAYGYFLLKVARLAFSKDLTSLFIHPTWTLCSGVVVVEQERMGTDIAPLRTAATQDPNFVCPADLYRWGLDNKWMGK